VGPRRGLFEVHHVKYRDSLLVFETLNHAFDPKPFQQNEGG